MILLHHIYLRLLGFLVHQVDHMVSSQGLGGLLYTSSWVAKRSCIAREHRIG